MPNRSLIHQMIPKNLRYTRKMTNYNNKMEKKLVVQKNMFENFRGLFQQKLRIYLWRRITFSYERVFYTGFFNPHVE